MIQVHVLHGMGVQVPPSAPESIGRKALEVAF